MDATTGVERFGDTMFWMFEPTEQAVPDTLVIWLNGGKDLLCTFYVSFSFFSFVDCVIV